MWRDILLVIGFAFTALAYFGLTPKRVAVYAESAKADISKKTPRQKRYLFTAIALTPLYIFLAVWGVDKMGLAYSLMTVAIVILLWGGTLRRVWNISGKWKKIRRGVTYGGMFSLMLAADILSPIPPWEKVALPLAGIGIASGIHWLTPYVISRRRKRKRISQVSEKDSPH